MTATAYVKMCVDANPENSKIFVDPTTFTQYIDEVLRERGWINTIRTADGQVGIEIVEGVILLKEAVCSPSVQKVL